MNRLIAAAEEILSPFGYTKEKIRSILLGTGWQKNLEGGEPIPCHEVYCGSCESLYGEPFPAIHRWMDEPVVNLGGSHQVERHDIEKTPDVVKSLFGEEAEIVARDHILLDKKWSEKPEVSKRKVRFPQLEHFKRKPES